MKVPFTEFSLPTHGFILIGMNIWVSMLVKVAEKSKIQFPLTNSLIVLL